MSDDDADGGTRSRANETRTDDADSDGEGWRFAVDEVGPDGVTEDTHTPEDVPIEPGDIEVEHAVFIVLGVAITVGVLFVGL